MKKVLTLICAFLFSSVCATSFGGVHGVVVPDPTIRVVYPRVVQRSVVPTCGCAEACECGAVTDPRVAKVKVVYPRVVQRSVVVPTCGCAEACECGAVADPRVAKVKVVHPRVVRRSLVVPTSE